MDVFLWSVLYINFPEKITLFKYMLNSTKEFNIEHFLILVVFDKKYENDEDFKKDIIIEINKIKDEYNKDKKDFFIIKPYPNNNKNFDNKNFYNVDYNNNLFDYYEYMYKYLISEIDSFHSENKIIISDKQPITFIRDVDLILPNNPQLPNEYLEKTIPINLIIRGKQYISNSLEKESENMNIKELLEYFPSIKNKNLETNENQLLEIIDLSGFTVPFGIIKKYYEQRKSYFDKYLEYPIKNKQDIKFYEKIKFIDFIEEYARSINLNILTPLKPFIFHRLGKIYEIN